MESGEKFWTGAKRFPRSAELDMASEQHAAFVLATANLLAAGCGLSPQEEGLLPLDHPQRDAEGIGSWVLVGVRCCICRVKPDLCDEGFARVWMGVGCGMVRW